MTFRRKKEIVSAGKVDTNLYIITEGICRISWQTDNQEYTLGFGEEGSVFLSPQGFYVNAPAFYSLITVDNTEVLRVPRSLVFKLMEESHMFLLWFTHELLNQYAGIENRHRWRSLGPRSCYRDMTRTSDYARSGFRNLRQHYPSILSLVNNKVLAGYLGVNPGTLCHIKKELLDEERRANAARRAELGLPPMPADKLHK